MYYLNLFCMLSLTMGTVEVFLLYTPLLPYTPQCLCHTQTYSDKGRPTQGRCHLETLGNGAQLQSSKPSDQCKWGQYLLYQILIYYLYLVKLVVKCYESLIDS